MDLKDFSELLLVEDVFQNPTDEADPNSVEHDRSVEEHLSVLSFFWIQSIPSLLEK